MATTEPGISPPATASEVGRHLRTVRKAQGLSRAEVARSAGLTRRELAAYERGRIPVPDSDLWCLAGSCGVDVSELLPSRDKLKVNSELGSLTVGDSVARLRAGASSDGLLREYLAMIYELRNLPPGTRPPMREQDLAALADALGSAPEAIEARLHELIGVTREEAARLRAMILPPLSLPAASPTPLPDPTAYAQTPFTAFDATVGPAPAPVLAPEPPVFDFAMASTSVGDPDATDRFFAAPLVDDPFAAPPPLEPLAPMASSAAPAPLAPLAPLEPSAPATPAAPEPAAFDPFAPPTAAPIDPFAAPTGLPVGIDAPAAAPPMPTFDPFSPAGTPTETPLAAPTRAPDSDPFDPGTFDPGTFDPATFDPGAFDPGAFAAGAAAAPEVPDPFAADDLGTTEDGDGFLADLGDDPAFAIEVVALGPDEAAATMVEPVETEPEAATAAAPEESWLATWETLAEHNRETESTDGDPFAALRVPLDAVFGAETEVDGSSDPFGPEPGFDAPVTAGAAGFVATPTETPGAEVDVDAFADAFEPIVETEPAPMPAAAVETVADRPVEALDDEPDGEWFDRAAAATAALVADHLQTESQGETESEEPLAEADVDEHQYASLFHDADADVDAELDAELDEVLAAAPVAGLAPISWSLFPPAADEAAHEVAVEDADAPVDIDDTTPEPDEAPVVADAQFVAAGTDWQIGGIFPATAMADDGTLALRRADVRWALADLVAGDDFAARATVDFTAGAGFGILFRVSVDDSERISGYSFDVDPIYGGGGFLLRQWHDNRQHWKPLAHAPVADPTRLYGHHTIEVQLRADELTASVDGEVVLTVRQLSRCSIDSGREPCRGTRLGVQAWSTTEVTVDRLLLAR